MTCYNRHFISDLCMLYKCERAKNTNIYLVVTDFIKLKIYYAQNRKNCNKGNGAFRKEI